MLSPQLQKLRGQEYEQRKKHEETSRIWHPNMHAQRQDQSQTNQPQRRDQLRSKQLQTQQPQPYREQSPSYLRQPQRRDQWLSYQGQPQPYREQSPLYQGQPPPPPTTTPSSKLKQISKIDHGQPQPQPQPYRMQSRTYQRQEPHDESSIKNSIIVKLINLYNELFYNKYFFYNDNKDKQDVHNDENLIKNRYNKSINKNKNNNNKNKIIINKYINIINLRYESLIDHTISPIDNFKDINVEYLIYLLSLNKLTINDETATLINKQTTDPHHNISISYYNDFKDDINIMIGILDTAEPSLKKRYEIINTVQKIQPEHLQPEQLQTEEIQHEQIQTEKFQPEKVKNKSHPKNLIYKKTNNQINLYSINKINNNFVKLHPVIKDFLIKLIHEFPKINTISIFKILWDISDENNYIHLYDMEYQHNYEVKLRIFNIETTEPKRELLIISYGVDNPSKSAKPIQGMIDKSDIINAGLNLFSYCMKKKWNGDIQNASLYTETDMIIENDTSQTEENTIIFNTDKFYFKTITGEGFPPNVLKYTAAREFYEEIGGNIIWNINSIIDNNLEGPVLLSFNNIFNLINKPPLTSYDPIPQQHLSNLDESSLTVEGYYYIDIENKICNINLTNAAYSHLNKIILYMHLHDYFKEDHTGETTGVWMKKYLKYKQKYLNLINSLNSL